jgi:hypothetical protein
VNIIIKKEKERKRAIGCDGIQRVGGVKRKWKKSLHIKIKTGSSRLRHF